MRPFGFAQGMVLRYSKNWKAEKAMLAKHEKRAQIPRGVYDSCITTVVFEHVSSDEPITEPFDSTQIRL